MVVVDVVVLKTMSAVLTLVSDPGTVVSEGSTVPLPQRDSLRPSWELCALTIRLRRESMRPTTGVHAVGVVHLHAQIEEARSQINPVVTVVVAVAVVAFRT